MEREKMDAFNCIEQHVCNSLDVIKMDFFDSTTYDSWVHDAAKKIFESMQFRTEQILASILSGYSQASKTCLSGYSQAIKTCSFKPKIDFGRTIYRIQKKFDELIERDNQFIQELELVEAAYRRSDTRFVDQYIEGKLGLSPQGLCIALHHLKLDQKTMREQLRIALFDFLKNKETIIQGFKAKIGFVTRSAQLLVLLKDWLFWKTQEWARNHVQSLKPWINFEKKKVPIIATSIEDFTNEDVFAGIIDKAVRERYYSLMNPEAILIQKEEGQADFLAFKQRYELLTTLELELSNLNDAQSRQLTKLLQLLLSGRCKRRCEVLQQGFTESNWNALKQRIKRRTRNLQLLAA